MTIQSSHEPVPGTLSSGRLPNFWPFTDPLTDLHITLLAMPLFWLFGLEQILPVILIGWSFLKLIMTRRKVRIPPSTIVLALFLIWQLVPALFIDQTSNWIIFARNFTSYLTGWFILIIIANTINSPKTLNRTINVIIGLGAAVTVIGLLFALGLLPARFDALVISNLLPGGIRQSQFVQESIILREIGISDAIIAGIRYPRISSIFFFPTGAASGYLVFLPWLALGVATRHGIIRWMLAAWFVVSAAVFLLLAVRLALLVLLVVGIAAVILILERRFRFPRWFWPAVFGIVFVVAMLLLLAGFAPVLQVADTLFVDTRADSFSGRMEVYVATLESLAERPITGWGVPRELPTIRLAPAGTHGEYLAILYRFGLVGFTLYLAFFALVWVRIVSRLTHSMRQGSRYAFYFYVTVAASLLALNLNGLAHGLHFDLLVVLLLWVTIGLVYVKPSVIQQWGLQQPSRRRREKSLPDNANAIQ